MSATYASELDAQLGLPGQERPALAHACARELLASDAPSWDTPAWAAIDELEARAGFGPTRRAARSLLRRSDGRWLLFRYPFNDGSWRWIIPGGGAELGEGPIEAVTREVLEETGTTPRELRHTGMLMYHLLATSMRTGTPRLQYSPVLVGEIDDELPDTGGRETHWLTLEEFTAQPHRPVTDPLISLMRLVEHDEPLEPAAIWLPA